MSQSKHSQTIKLHGYNSGTLRKTSEGYEVAIWGEGDNEDLVILKGATKPKAIAAARRWCEHEFQGCAF